MTELVYLFFLFAKIGVVTFGGGYAMFPILQRELVRKRNWSTDEEISDFYVIAQCTPGIIAVNVATFIGCKRRGIPGGIAATLGVVSPSACIITIIAAFIANFAEYPIVKNAFAGIRACVCVLILNVVIGLFKKSVLDAFTAILFAVVFLISLLTDVSPVIFVPAAAVAGIVLKTISWRRAGK